MGNQDWSHLGNDIKNIVQSAIDSNDFSKLNDAIFNTVNQALNIVEESLGGKNSTAYQSAGSLNNKQKKVDKNDWESVVRQFEEERKNRRKMLPRNPYMAYKNRYASPSGANALAVTGIVSGSLLTIGCGIAELAMALVNTTGLSGVFASGVAVGMGVVAPFLAGGIFLLAKGCSLLGQVKRYKSYVEYLQDREFCKIRELETATGKSVKWLVKDIQKMIQKRWFKEGHFDYQKTNLIVTHQAYQHYLEAHEEYERRQLVQKQSVQQNKTASKEQENKTGNDELPENVRAVITEGRGYLEQIRRSNDAIPGVEISAKISRMELVVERIFERVERHPELVDELRYFMKYYLPTTVKLLHAYEELDVQTVQGPNIQKSKKDIEETLDTINNAFENLLDSFFEDSAVDISSDISVMQTMMNQEGLLHKSMKEKVKVQ